MMFNVKHFIERYQYNLRRVGTDFSTNPFARMEEAIFQQSDLGGMNSDCQKSKFLPSPAVNYDESLHFQLSQICFKEFEISFNFLRIKYDDQNAEHYISLANYYFQNMLVP